MSVSDNILETGVSTAEPGDYIALMKPRVMRLVVFTAFVGMLLAPGGVDPVLGFIAIMSIAVGAGASGALNMWYDADIDAVMQRTVGRPIPAGRISPDQALNFGLILSLFSVLILGLLVNWVAGALLAFTIFFYAVIYTMWLKRATPQNIVIGGAAGAFPPVIGWSVVTGTIAPESLVLFAIIFVWTPPHFWALALFRMRDYGDAGVPMMPNVAGERATRIQILVYSLILAPLGVMPFVLGFAGIVYGLVSMIAGAVFAWLAYRIWRIDGRDDAQRAEKRLFVFSIFYLFVLFAVLLVEAIAVRAGLVSFIAELI